MFLLYYILSFVFYDKTDRHNITEILLNMALSTINLTLNVCIKVFIQLHLLNDGGQFY
jgi:hypothetical protein